MNNKIGFISLGCPKNLVDSEVMMGQLMAAGYEITNNADEAETVVVNTCGFIESAKQESIEAILQATSAKANGKARGQWRVDSSSQRGGRTVARRRDPFAGDRRREERPGSPAQGSG